MRIGVVNDRPLVLEIICSVVAAAGHRVVWKSTEGALAVKLCCEDTPDLVLMDLNMPVMDGVEATRKIMSLCPCPVLVVTSDVHKHVSKIFEAMGAGALDAVSTPDGRPSENLSGKGGFLDKIAMIERLGKNPVQRNVRGTPVRKRTPLLAIGSSTGGPSALAAILGALPENFPAAVVIIQHVDGCFSDSLSRWLDSQAGIKVRLAVAGDTLKVGEALIAPGNKHLVIGKNGVLNFKPDNGESPYVPSVDIFFKSLGELSPVPGSVAVLLTGMGADGAEGLLKLRNLGWTTVAQDKESSVVWGMPGVAVKMGAATHILPLEAIGPTMVRHFNKARGME
ncbi:chemotaxis-specific protein-glutamate methyltransferase CheB [Maridesulfovibrio bastinii]|uniref:chemotaxis-specific protein-glutamate methyltransferase CheB n=1 Tax=Maridesulfovibrio bastinii TaxID=47157 RepID=UPI00040DCAC2|nr:chemotaxis-specific protein-glutamate methyltransferase CheB [Maridesulfovibrio bastinii]